MKRMILVVFLFLFVSTACFAENTVSMTSDPWPPFADPSHPHGGLSVEIARAAFKTQGYTVTMDFLPWARVLEMARRGDYDVIVGGWMREDRREIFLYSDPFVVNEIRFIKRVGDPFQYRGIESLEGLRIGVVRSYSYADDLAKYPELVLDPTSDFITNVRKLVAGRVDITLEDEIVAKNTLTVLAPDLVSKIEFTGPPYSSEPLHILSSRENPRHQEIIEAFNKGLGVIKENGTYDAILASYGLK